MRGMLALILVPFLLLGATVAHAEGDACQAASTLAKSIMSARQNGVAMSTVMGIAGSDSSLKSLVESMVIQAYDSPRYSTEGMKERAIQDFENDIYLQCIKANRK